MKMFKRILFYGKIIFAFLIIIFGGLGLLTAVNALPEENIKNNAGISIREIQQEWLKYEESDKSKNIFYLQNVPDYFTDLVMYILIYEADADRPFHSALYNRMDKELISEYRDEFTDRIFADQTYDTTKSYGRMWHGYSLLLRPMLLFFTYSQIRIIWFIMLLLLCIAVMYLLYKKISWRAALCFFIAINCIYIYSGAVSLNFSLMFMVSFSTIIVLLLFSQKDNFVKLAPAILFLSGCLENFFNWLSIGIPLGITAAVTLMIVRKRGDNVNFYKLFLLSTLAWLAGYGLTFLMKWGLTDIFTDLNIIGNAWNQIIFRSFGTAGDIQSRISLNGFLYTLGMCLFIFFTNVLTLILCSVTYIAFMILNITRRTKPVVKQKSSNALSYRICLILAALFPVFYMIFLFNHSIVHIYIYTWKLLFLSAFCISALFLTEFKAH
jgi:hypothetical protein